MSSKRLELAERYLGMLHRTGGAWTNILKLETESLWIDLTVNRKIRSAIQRATDLGLSPTPGQKVFIRRTDPVIQDFEPSIARAHPTQSGSVLVSRAEFGLERQLDVKDQLENSKAAFFADTKELIALAPEILKALISGK